MNSLSETVRFCADIGMFAIDRSREDSCVHATEFCERTCYNNKLEATFGHTVGPKDVRNDEAWYGNDAIGLSRKLSAARRQTKRARLMTRGEAFRDQADIARVTSILEAMPGTTWWIPTRSWRDPLLFHNVRQAMARFPNVRLMASTDPETTDAEYRALERKGLSTMFYGEDDRGETPSGTRMFKCPKTHRNLKAHCAICKAGCFSRRQVHVHLREH